MRKLLGCLIILFITTTSSTFATDWYVRPAGGNYDAENGTSYANAWDGLDNVVWGTSGVVAGDTLYVCGTHIHTVTNAARLSADGYIELVSGSAGSPIVIRGDYSGDPGIIWGVYIPAYESWVSEGSNTYSITQGIGHYDGFVFDDIGTPNYDSYTLLTKATSIQNCKDTAGSFYFDGTAQNDKVYVHCADGGDPTGTVALCRWGYRFNMEGVTGLNYITFQNIKLFSIYRWTFLANYNHTHWTFDNCTIWYADSDMFAIGDTNHYMTITNCDLAYGRTLIYTQSSGNDAASYYEFSNNTVHHSGHPYFPAGDKHGIATQGGHDGIISGNEIYEVGEGIGYYIYKNQDCYNNICRYNFVYGLDITTGNGQGILYGSNVAQDANQGTTTGNQCYENICIGPGEGSSSYGIYYKGTGELECYNNVCYNFDKNYRFAGTYLNEGVHVELKNNISLSPIAYHIEFITYKDPGEYAINSDYNDFYPIAGNQFYFYDASSAGEYTLSQWQSISRVGCTFDPTSFTSDPKFSNASGSYSNDSDFQLRNDSPAIDTGTDVGLTEDYAGTTIPQGFAPDIGAYEYTSGSNPLIANINASPTSGTAPLSVSFTGSASGGTSPYSYSWDFDDGGSSSAQNPSHLYSTAGTYTGTLTVTDNGSNQDTDTVVISATNQINPLVVSVSASPSSGTAPLSVSFTGSASGGTSPYSYSWNFGDGGSSTAQNPSHTYSNPGTYIAILTATDSSSSQTTDSLTLNVSSSSGTQQLLLSSITGSPAPDFGGTTDPTPGSYDYNSGSLVSVRAIPNTDYRFSEWEGDVIASDAFNQQFTLNLDTDKDLSAYFCTRCGDVNGNLTVTASDAQGAFDIFLGRNSSPTKCETENADVSCDSNVTPADAQAIFNKFIMKGELPADCSGNTRALYAQSLSIQAAQPPEIHLIVDDAEVNSNGYVYVPIIIDNPSNIDAFGFDLQFPSEVMEFVTFDVTELLEEYNQVDAYYTEEGLLRVGGYSSALIVSETPDVLITLIFRVKEEIIAPISLVITNKYDDIKNATVKNGTITNTIEYERESVDPSERERIIRRLRRMGIDNDSGDSDQKWS